MAKKAFRTLAGLLVIALCTGFCGTVFYKEYIDHNLEENASYTGIVVDKESSHFRGYHFSVSVEHETTDIEGNKTTLLKEYTVTPDIYYDIEIGDTVTTNKDSYEWKIVSYGTATEKR